MIARIATVGDNCIDRYLPPVDRSLVGGNAVNVAVNLRRSGHETAYFGAVGDDEEGLRTRAVLARLDVDVQSLKIITPGCTSVTVIATGPDGDRHFVTEDFGVCRGYRPDDRDMLRLKTMTHVHIGWLEGRPWSKGAPTTMAGTWKASADRFARYVADSPDVAAAMEKKDVQLLDARAPSMYLGLFKRDYVYGYGHIPAARNVPLETLFVTRGGVIRLLTPEIYRAVLDRKSTRLNSSHIQKSRMPSSA